jgi:uncharacterized small protein (DUF1192 family)
MTTTATPRAALPLLAAAQAQKHVTHNDALLQLDALLFARFLSRNVSTPPTTPADGDTYLVKATASGAWTGQNGEIAYASSGVWRFTAPFTGLTAYVVDEAKLVVFNGTGWVDYASTLALQNVPLLGVNASADATNKFAVSSSALLFNNVGNGVQVKLNKNAATDTASLLYQTGFSGRAEIGLTGDDNFHFKVSADGTSFNEAVRLVNSDGHVLVNTTADNGSLTVGGVIAPEANNTRDLGTSTFAFRNGFIAAIKAQAGSAAAPSLTFAGSANTGLFNPAANVCAMATNGTEVARFDAGGNFCINTTGLGGKLSVAGNAVLSATGANTIQTGSDATHFSLLQLSAASGGATAFYSAFLYNNVTQVGGITSNATTTTYATTSDARLKTVLDAQQDYRAAIRALWVGDFEWRESGAKSFGVLAQQAYEVMPHGIGVTRPENETDHWQASSEPFAHLALWGVKDLYAVAEVLAEKIARLEARLHELETRSTAGGAR